MCKSTTTHHGRIEINCMLWTVYRRDGHDRNRRNAHNRSCIHYTTFNTTTNNSLTHSFTHPSPTAQTAPSPPQPRYSNAAPPSPPHYSPSPPTHCYSPHPTPVLHSH